MLSLYDAVSAECGSALYGSAVMGGGLVLAARSDVAHDEGVILVFFDPRKRSFSLSYRNRDVQPDQFEDCSEEEVSERLRLYIAYQFGIYTKPKKDLNQSPNPTVPSGRGSA